MAHCCDRLSKPRSFHRYLTVGGFPELALTKDDYYAQRMLREDVVDKVLKRDIPSLFKVRNAAVLEKVFLYLCFHSLSIINFAAMSKELDNTPVATVASHIQFLEKANLIYISNLVNLDGKKVLKAKPKIYIADAVIRNAVLMLDNVLIDPVEMGTMVETSIYKHFVAFYYRYRTKVGYYRRTGGNEKRDKKAIKLREFSAWRNQYSGQHGATSTKTSLKVRRISLIGSPPFVILLCFVDDVIERGIGRGC